MAIPFRSADAVHSFPLYDSPPEKQEGEDETIFRIRERLYQERRDVRIEVRFIRPSQYFPIANEKALLTARELKRLKDAGDTDGFFSLSLVPEYYGWLRKVFDACVTKVSAELIDQDGNTIRLEEVSERDHLFELLDRSRMLSDICEKALALQVPDEGSKKNSAS